MGTNRRYEDRIAQRSHERWLNGGRRPIGLPDELEAGVRWHKPGVPVWAWVYWDDRSVSRIATHALGWSDRVVVVRAPGDDLIAVWRNAVTHRTEGPREDS